MYIFKSKEEEEVKRGKGEQLLGFKVKSKRRHFAARVVG